MRHLKVMFGILMVLLLALVACKAAPAEVLPTAVPVIQEDVVEEVAVVESGKISIAGSTTNQAVSELLAEAFMSLNSDVEITVEGGGSSTGVKSVAEGLVDIGNSSREVKSSEFEAHPDLVVHVIAKDGVAVVVHPDNPVAELTSEQVKQIFLGEIQNWSELGGNNEMITVVVREEGSGTRATFDELALDNEIPTALAVIVSSNGNMVTTVSTTPNSVGYVSFGYLDESTKPLAINGALPTPANVLNGSFPVSRNINMITKGEPTALVQAFLDFVLSDAGQKIIADDGFIALQ